MKSLKALVKNVLPFLNKFKKETSITLGKYIQRAKLEETKNLLEFSDTSILDISIIFIFHHKLIFKTCLKRNLVLLHLNFESKKEKLFES